MASIPTLGVFSCRWDWCRSSFPSVDALDTHVKHDHIWPMKPMRKAEIALMRRMDLQSLHSSLNTDSSIISRGISSTSAWSGPQTSMTLGLIAGVSHSRTPPQVVPPTSNPQAHKCPQNEEFDTFTQLSSPPTTHSPQRLPASPALEGLVRQDGHTGLSAAVEMYERTHGHKTNQYLRLPSHQRSPTHRPLSQSSGSSQEVVEQQLTQEDDVGSQPLLPSEPLIGNELIDTELRWPTDDESDVPAAEDMWNSEQAVSKQDYGLGSSPDSARGQNFRCGSLNVPLGVNVYNASPPSSSLAPHASQGSHTPPFALQTQAPYSSQTMGWGGTQ